jgi:hypothetical protein
VVVLAEFEDDDPSASWRLSSFQGQASDVEIHAKEMLESR